MGKNLGQVRSNRCIELQPSKGVLELSRGIHGLTNLSETSFVSGAAALALSFSSTLTSVRKQTAAQTKVIREVDKLGSNLRI